MGVFPTLNKLSLTPVRNLLQVGSAPTDQTDAAARRSVTLTVILDVLVAAVASRTMTNAAGEAAFPPKPKWVSVDSLSIRFNKRRVIQLDCFIPGSLLL